MSKSALLILAAVLVAVAPICCCGEIFKAIEALPTVRPTPQLIEGNEYWLGGVELGPIRDYWINLLSLPEHGPDSTIVAVVSDSSRVRLVNKKGDWCYIEVVDEYFRDPTLTNDEIEEGWIDCSRLLDYQPTPLPTPIRTPQRPSD